MSQPMRFASALATGERDLDKICQHLIAQVRLQLGDFDPNFVLVSISPHFISHAAKIATSLRHALMPQVIIGCSAESVIGQDQEVEQKTAISVVAAYLPQVQMEPFSLQSANWRTTLQLPLAFQRNVPLPAESKLVLILADPFSTPTDRVLSAFNTFYPDLPLCGGLASGSFKAGGNALILNDRVLGSGLVGVAFGGALEVDVIVSQGCRPIGRPLKVTAAYENYLLKLEDKVPLDYLKEMVNELPTDDRELLQNGLFIGRAIDKTQTELGRGDFLVRAVTGIDQKDGSLVVGDYIRGGEVVQFHLRDADTAQEDLEMMLMPQLFNSPAAGVLLFSCNGRGTRLYAHPNGDVRLIKSVLNNISVGGFFCAGEIGPIGGQNFLHGHTASLALFRSTLHEEKSKDEAVT